MLKPIRPLMLVGALMCAPASVDAQINLQSGDEIIERVVAVVGDSVILQSQIEEELGRLRVQGFPLPESDLELEQVRGDILNELVNLMLVLQEAQQDSLLQIDDVQIEERVTQQMESITQQLGGQTAFQQALAQEGYTLAEYRDYVRETIRRGQTQQAFLQMRLRDQPDVEISEQDLLDAWQAARGQIEQRPKMITFDQVVLKPEASEASREAARAEARALLDSLRAGAEFEALAERYSDDPGTAVQGGDLGWFRRGGMVAPFDQAAFALLDGQTSGVVETEYGYHIIRIERSRRAERRGRHILITPDIGEADVQLVRDSASSVLVQASAGASMDDLYDRYGDPEAPDSLTVTMQQISTLPAGYGVVASAVQGQVLGPIEYTNVRGETRVSVLKVIEVREAGAYTFEDVRSQLADQLQGLRKQAALIEDLRAKTHIEIRR